MPHRKLLHSFRFAFRGIYITLKTERNMRLHFLFTALALYLCYLLRLDTTDYVLITLASGMVLIAELFNTIIEKSLDVTHPGYNNKVRDIKDMAAGAVLLSAVFAIIIGIFVYSKSLIFLFNTVI